MEDRPKSRRARRQFDDDFKTQAVRLVLDEGKSIAATARDLDLTESALRHWVERARADRTQGMDAALPVDAQHAPTGRWESQAAPEIPTAPTPLLLV